MRHQSSKSTLHSQSKRRQNKDAKRRMIVRAYTPGNWIQYPKEFLAAMSSQRALLLAYLIDEHGKVYGEYEREWFPCDGKKIENAIFMSVPTQMRELKFLKNEGYIETKRENKHPPTRLVRINFTAIKERIDGAVEKWESKFA